MRTVWLRPWTAISILAVLSSLALPGVPSLAAPVVPPPPLPADYNLFMPVMFKPGVSPNHAPNLPASPTPADLSADRPLDQDLSWTGGDPDGDALTYDVYFEAGDATPDVLAANDQAGSSFDPGALAYSTAYYWQIVATDEHGLSTDGPVWSFTTAAAPPLNQPPNAPSSPSPVDASVDRPLDQDLSWTGGDPDGDALTYDVYFEAGDPNPDVLAANDQAGSSFDPGALAYSTVYYWQIVASDEHGLSTDGPVWRFTTAAAPPLNQAPNVPASPTPADASADRPLDQDLSWTGGDPDGDALTYDVYFEAGDATPDVLAANDQAALTFDPGALAYNTAYYWQIISTDEHGLSTDGPVWRFTTTAAPHSNNAPNTPASPTPPDASADRPANQDLSWTGGDPDGDAVTYDVYFEAGDATPDVLASGDQAGPSFDPGALAYSTTYYWQIVSTDEHGLSTSGLAWRFTTHTQSPPNLPASPVPADLSIDRPSGQDLSWTGGDPDGDALTYDVYLEAGDATPDVLAANDQAGSSFDPGALAYNTVYYWQIVASDEHGATASSPVWRFTTHTQSPPDAPASPVPADLSVDRPLDQDLSWTGGDPDGDAVTYDLYFEAGDATPDALASGDQASPSFDPGALAYNTTYYWQIISTDEHDGSTASPVWRFTTHAEGHPNAPAAPTPADGSADQLLALILSWTGGDPDGDAVTYDLYFEAGNPSPSVLVADDQAGLTFDPGPLAYSTAYYWQVVATDEHGLSTNGPVWSFSTHIQIPPNTPFDPIPADGVVNQPLDQDLFWSGGDPDGDAVTYDVYFEAGNPAPGMLVADDQAGLTFDPGALTFNTVYYWQIVSTDEHGDTSAGPVWSFTAHTQTPPNTPFDPIPPDGAVDQPLDQDLFWSGGDPDGDVVFYDVYFGFGDPDPTTLVRDNLEVTSYDPGELYFNITYYWKIVATDEHGATTSGPVWSFTAHTQSPPDAPANPAPPDLSVDRPLDQDLSWTGGDPDGDAVTYDVYFEAGDNTPDVLLSNDQTELTFDPGLLANGTTFYWQIVAADEHLVTTYSPVWSFTTVNQPPNMPSNPSPANGVTNQMGEMTLTWSGGDPDGDSVTYDLYLEPGDNTPDVLLADDLATTSRMLGTLPWDGLTYYWQVIATDQHGLSTAGPVWNYSTHLNRPPNMPSNPNPADGAILVSTSATLSFGVSDPDGGDGLTVYVYFGTSSPPGNELYYPYKPSMSVLTTYYWRVFLVDEHGAYTEGPVWSFTTGLW